MDRPGDADQQNDWPAYAVLLRAFRGHGRRVGHRGSGAGDAVAGELNPLAMSHTPMHTSHRPPGIEEARPKPDPMNSDSMPTKMIAYPTRPQMAKSRGTNFALYNV